MVTAFGLALPLITLFFRTILSAIQYKPKPQETKKSGLIAPEPMEPIGATTQSNTPTPQKSAPQSRKHNLHN